MNRTAAAIILFSLAASLAQAQLGNYAFEVSTDGTSWNNSVTVAAGTVIHTRLRATWSGVSGTSVGYAGGQFDVTLQGASALSSVSDIQRPFPFDFSSQAFGATSYAQGIKIDDAQDFAAPGAGARWVGPGQQDQLHAPPDTYNSNNPCTVFTFDVLAFDSIHIGLVLNSVTGRAMALYTDPGGSQQRLNASAVSVTNAIINIPAPSACAFVSLCGLSAIRRRRSS